MTRLILGAGLAGLSAARVLVSAGHSVRLWDKSRGVGGRLATRRGESGILFDHGAQYFTVRDPGLQNDVQHWLAAGVVRVWTDDFPTNRPSTGEPLPKNPRYIGTPGMNALAKHLAAGLPLETDQKAVRIHRREAGWEVVSEHGHSTYADHLILTMPAPQVLPLLSEIVDRFPVELLARLQRIEYDPCLALLVRLKAPSRLPEPGGLFCGPEPIAWMADQQQKQGSGPAVVLHAGPKFSREFYEAEESSVAERMLAEAKPWLSDVLEAKLHRWRYSIPKVTDPERCLGLQVPGGGAMVFAGDAFGGPRVEGAILSGRAAGFWLTERDTRSEP